MSNGLFPHTLLDEPGLKLLDEDHLQHRRRYCGIRRSPERKGHVYSDLQVCPSGRRSGYDVQITTCVHRGNVGREPGGHLLLERAISWAEGLGAHTLNFHPLFKMGIARDSWTGETDISPEEWVDVYTYLRAQIDTGAYDIAVRLPQRFVWREVFDERPSYLGFCPVKLAERIEVHQNGQIHSCALNNGTRSASLALPR